MPRTRLSELIYDKNGLSKNTALNLVNQEFEKAKRDFRILEIQKGIEEIFTLIDIVQEQCPEMHSMKICNYFQSKGVQNFYITEIENSLGEEITDYHNGYNQSHDFIGEIIRVPLESIKIVCSKKETIYKDHLEEIRHHINPFFIADNI